MIKPTLLSLGLALGFATAANAAFLPLPDGIRSGPVVTVAEGCGPGWFRGRGGRCNPLYGPGGRWRGGRFACPPGMHVGPYGGRCWPNR